jgi:polyisoprenoid-binding protein YceI
MKKTFLFIGFLSLSGLLMAQKLTTTSAVISFDATTPKDALPKAENKTVIASLDKKTGAVAFEAAVNNFTFSNPSMQDHFNGEKWMNSAAFPKFTFSGKINKLSEVKFNKNGTYTAKVSGNLTIKNVTRPITTTAKVTVKGNKITTTSNFTIVLADYGIKDQQPIESGKVAREVKVIVSANF